MYAATCQVCQDKARWSEEVIVVLVFAPGLTKPYPLIAAEGYRYCIGGSCDALLTLVRRAVASHPVTRSAGQWTRAIVLHADGSGTNVLWKGSGTVAMA
ncbi:MAG: hypothetical protein E6J78_04685 [Deltaproteobacteria bacterium]|nr:MAG: hypothetical protein E6J78_04685 [Deltaproteobacteria bacterium]